MRSILGSSERRSSRASFVSNSTASPGTSCDNSCTVAAGTMQSVESSTAAALATQCSPARGGR